MSAEESDPALAAHGLPAEEEAECVHTQSWEQVGISLAVFIFSAQ